jgi:hypothetical protein
MHTHKHTKDKKKTKLYSGAIIIIIIIIIFKRANNIYVTAFDLVLFKF